MDLTDKLLAMAADLFRQCGVKSVTMEDISRKAGISKKTLYLHFSNKQEVVSAAVAWYQQQVCSSCIQVLQDSANAVEGMVKLTRQLDGLFSQMHPYALLELETYYPESYAAFKKGMLDHDVPALKQNLESGAAEGLYRAGLDLDFLAKYRLQLSLMMFHNNLLMENGMSLSRLVHQINEHFLFGIMTPKGEKLYNEYKKKYLAP